MPKQVKRRKPIRTGFWYIAKAAGVPIVLMYANSQTKQGGILGKIYPTEINHDLALLKQLYKEKVGLDITIPEPQNIPKIKTKQHLFKNSKLSPFSEKRAYGRICAI